MLKRILFALTFLFSAPFSYGQDVSVTAILAPSNGCGLTASEQVIIRIFNFGPDLSGTPFNVSYSVNGGAPVVESATFPSFLTNSTVTYTFAATANLSVAGTYTLDARTLLGGDINSSNDAFNGYLVVNSSPSAGGTIAGDTNVCITANSGVLTLSGHTGNVLNWEYSTDGGSTWINISNTTTTQSYNNLTIPTQYRARVQNASCAVAISDTASMTIDPPTVGGTTAGSTTRCSGSNSGNITLSGHTGTVLNWEFTTDGGASWTPIANTTTTQAYLNLTVTTGYRAVIQSGACAFANSSTSTITINPLTVGGNLSPLTTTVCSGVNSGTLTLSGHTGAVQRWEFSTNGGASWTNIANTTVTQTFTNLAATRLYRALVKSGACSSEYSDTATVTVTAGTTAGSVTTSTTVCSGINSGTLTLAGHVGTILNWQFSTNGGGTWSNIANTTTTEVYLNLTQSTLYRAVVQNGTCPTGNSTAATITVNNASVGGTVAGSSTVCASGNSGTLSLSGQTGAIQSWEFSNDGGVTWTTIANTTTSQNYSNLTDTTLYHVLVKNGVCANDTSANATITVDPVTMGGTVSSNTTVCNGNNAGTLTLTGQTGSVLNWEVSTDGGLTWLSIINTTTSQSYNNITNSSFYRAQVKSGLCTAQYSGPAIITLDPAAVGGNLYGSSTVCSGSNSGALTLVGYSQSVMQWENSTDNGATWSTIANTTPTENYSNVTQTTWYRTIVSSGVCPNDTSTIAVLNVDSNSVGGVTSSNATVCSGANSGTVTLSGQTGSVQNWYISTDGGNSWLVVGNTTTSYSYLNLTQTSLLKAEVKYGVCPAAQSAPVTITVDPNAVGGTISSNATICQGLNSGTVTLGGYTGTISDWESSVDNGATWTPLGNTSSTNVYTNVQQTTWYHAIVSSGVCPNDTSSIVTIQVDSLSVGGALSSSDSVCYGNNGDTITISGHYGTVQAWYVSTDGGNTWLVSGNTGTTYPYSNLTQTIMIKADVQNGVCAAAQSSQVTIYVSPLAVGGILSSDATVCQVSNTGTVTLNGYVGNVANWESSIDNGITWTPLGNSTNSNPYNNLQQTTWYHTIVSSGVCANDTSSIVTITVDSASVGGVVSKDSAFCMGQITDTLWLAGQYGNVQYWSVSTDGINWFNNTNTSSQQIISNPTSTTWYTAWVKNGVCPAVSSDTAIISLVAASAAGTLSGPLKVCEKYNADSIYHAGGTGVITDWISSMDNGATFTSTGTSLSSYGFSGITTAMIYGVIVQNQNCPADTGYYSVGINPKPVLVAAGDTVCFGYPVQFTNSSSISSGFITSYNWNLGDGNFSTLLAPSHLYADTGNYVATLSALSNLGCPDTLLVPSRVNSVPSSAITLSSATADICEGDTVILSGTNLAGLSYVWSSGDTAWSIPVDTSGVWVLTVTDSLTGCWSKDSVETFLHFAAVIDAGPDITIPTGESTTLSVNAIPAGGTYTYSWTPAPDAGGTTAAPIVTPSVSTEYFVTVTTEYGCEAIDSVMVTLDLNLVELFIPNLITPNGDGFNDKFEIKKLPLFPKNTLAILNRNGQVVFTMDNYDNSWEGEFKGTVVPDGTYYYVLTISAASLEKEFKGPINVLRSK